MSDGESALADENSNAKPRLTSPPSCYPKSPVTRSSIHRRPECRYPDVEPEIHFKQSKPIQVLQVQAPGAHQHWGLPILKENVPFDVKKEIDFDYDNGKFGETDLKMAPGKTIYELADGHRNPPGWWDIYEWRMSQLNYTTSNSEYAKYPPTAYILPVIYRVKDRSFSNEQGRFPFYRHRSLNVKNQNC